MDISEDFEISDSSSDEESDAPMKRRRIVLARGTRIQRSDREQVRKRARLSEAPIINPRRRLPKAPGKQ